MIHISRDLHGSVSISKILYRLSNVGNKRNISEDTRSVINSIDMEKRARKRFFSNADKKEYAKRKTNFYESPPTIVNLFVLGSGGNGTTQSVILSTNQATSYLFNCGEGTSRLFTEQSTIKLTSLENIFITYRSWANVGGLLGMALNLGNDGNQITYVHGPYGVDASAVHSLQYSENEKPFIEKVPEWKKNYTDNCVSIDYVPLLPEELENLYISIEKEENEFDNAKQNQMSNEHNISPDLKTAAVNQKAINSEEGENLKSDLQEEDASTSNQDADPPAKKKKLTVHTRYSDPKAAMAYVVKPHQKSRKVNLEKCVDLGIKSGPDVGKLKRLESVTLSDGRVIHPDQVLDEAVIEGPIVVVECPSDDYLYSLLQSKPLLQCQSNNPAADLVIHMSSSAIIDNHQYQLFIQRFPESTKHIFLNEKCSGLIQRAVIDVHTLLNILHPTIFPTLPLIDEHVKNPESKNMVYGKPFLQYAYRGSKTGFSWDSCIDVNAQEVIRMDHTKKCDPMKEFLEFNEIMAKETPDNKGSNYPEVAFLGTGSSMPSLLRNVSGILLNIDEETSMLLDCGEGTSSQLYRLYGDKTDEILIKLKAIFISHLHPDHHIGMTGVLHARSAALKRAGMKEEPILLLAPIQYRSWLGENIQYVGSKDFTLVVNQFCTKEPYIIKGFKPNDTFIQKVMEKLNLIEYQTIPVLHVRHSVAVSLKHKSGWKIVYSGDTLPCGELAKAAKDCDLLIHEGTFGVGFHSEAQAKRHSTISAALDIGMQMNAKFTILTHFSQRYPIIPLLDDEKRHSDYPYGIAFDYMKVKLGDLHMLNKLLPVLKSVFKDDMKYMETRENKKSNKDRLKKMILNSEQTSNDNIRTKYKLPSFSKTESADENMDEASTEKQKRQKYHFGAE